MIIFQRILAGFFLLWLTGCATAPKDAPAFEESLLETPSNSEALLVVYRVMTTPTAYSAKVFVNEKEIFEIPNETVTWKKIKPGSNTISIKWPTWLGIPAAGSGEGIEINAEAGNYYFVEVGGTFHVVGTTGYSRSKLIVRSYKKSIAIIRKCCRYVPATQSQ